MKFRSEKQRKAVMAKLNRGKTEQASPRVPRRTQPPTYRTRDRPGCWARVERAIRRGDRDFKDDDWSAACFRYHQAAEQACYGAGGCGRHNIIDLLRSLDAPIGIREAGGRLNRFRRGDEYASEEEVQTGRIIEASVVSYSRELAQQAREDMQVVVAWCRGGPE